MNRERAEKWLDDHDKKPCFDPMYGFLWGTIQPSYCLPNACFDTFHIDGALYCHQSFPDEETAREWAIEQLMKLDEPEVDVRELARDWIVANLPDPHSSWNVDFYQKAFIAGFEAAKRGEG